MAQVASRTEAGHRVVRFVKRFPMVSRLTGTDSYQMLRHRATLLMSDRRSRTFTHFLRAPTQFDVLAGPVLTHFSDLERELRVVVLGASNGAEAYSIASTLLARPGPAVPFSVHAYDIDPEMIEQARRARYSAAAVHDNPTLSDAFLSSTFERDGDSYVVRPEIVRRVRIGEANVFDPKLAARVGRADIVFVQNLLYHFKPRDAARAFRNVVELLDERAVLFVDGMDLSLRTKLTKACGLTPLDCRIEEIHEDARRVRGDSYPYVYFGLEPLRRDNRDWKRRYATIFYRNSTRRLPA